MISPIISMHGFKKKREDGRHVYYKNERLHSEERQRNRNRNEFGRGRRYEHRDRGTLTKGAADALRAMQGWMRGTNHSKADTTRTTALTRKTTGESTVSTPVRLSMGEPAVPGTTPLPAEKTGTTPPLVATTETTPLPAEKTGTTLPLVETTKLSPSPQRRQALRLPW